jgi:UDPglucose--hexose-1-phosphate uridylyltransferase
MGGSLLGKYFLMVNQKALNICEFFRIDIPPKNPDNRRMNYEQLYENPHRRFNPLTGEWVLVSPHRNKRPWQGLVEKLPFTKRAEYDPSCNLCPGNKRASGEVNPDYPGTYVFTNDFSALLPEIPEGKRDEKGLLVAEAEKGVCKVICFSPRHDLTVALMETADIRKVVDVWTSEYSELGKREEIGYVQIFENHTEMMGCSNPHPHCQIWSNQTVPELPAKETAHQAAYLERHGHCLLCSYLGAEAGHEERVVFDNGTFTALVPYWAVWPFEVLILPRRHVPSLAELTDAEKTGFADALRRMNIRYDNLFQTDFPYSMGIHQKPTDGEPHGEWHFHVHYFPPLIRSATIRKHMVGYELLAMPQRDITPEQGAARLRECRETHYSLSGKDRT